MRKLSGMLFILFAIGFLMADNPHLVYQDPNIKELRGVFALSDGKVWAVGTDGAVRKSTDNGETWQIVTISGASDYHLNAVFFRDANNGFIVGEKKADPDRFKGKIYRTTNGGASWDAQVNYQPEKYIPFKDVVFQIKEYGNPNRGYIAAGGGCVYYTMDGGFNWSRQRIDNTKKHCFHSVAFDLLSGNTIYAVGDAGDGTGIVAYNSGSGWIVEYPFPNLQLNFFGVSALYGIEPHIAASRGYMIFKDYQGQWTASHHLPDQNVLYGIGAVCEFVSNFLRAGSDEAILDKVGNVLHHVPGKYLKDVSLTRMLGYPGPSLISKYTFFVGKGGRIFRYDPQYNEWPPSISVTGEYRRVKCVIFDSEGSNPTHVYVYRSTVAEGPYILVADFNIPLNQYYVWYDNTVDFNVDYYYKINEINEVPTGVPSGPAHPSGLPNPQYPPPPVSNFYSEDYYNDDGGRSYNWWIGSEPTYVLYRDGQIIYLGTAVEFTDTSAVTGQNHEYKIRRRKYYTPQNDYIYSDPVVHNCTPINNLTPSAPTNLTGEKVSGGFMMRWGEPNNVDIHGYNIYRKIDDGNYIKVNLVPCPRPFWYDTPIGYRRLWYKVSAVDWAGNESGYSNEIYFDAAWTPDGNEQGYTAELVETKLGKIIPNPVTRTALINFSINKDDFVRLDIYDVSGRIVKNLIADNYTSGNHRLKIDMQSDNELSPGVYFVQMKTGDFKAIEKVIIGR